MDGAIEGVTLGERDPVDGTRRSCWAAGPRICRFAGPPVDFLATFFGLVLVVLVLAIAVDEQMGSDNERGKSKERGRRGGRKVAHTIRLISCDKDRS